MLKRRGRATVSRIRSITGFADRHFVKLKYSWVHNATLGTAVGAQVDTAMHGNSVYDPEFSTFGHQPYGFDQWAALYQRYRVHGSKAIVHVAPQTVTTAAANNFTTTYLLPVTNSSVLHSQTLSEMPRCRTRTQWVTNVTRPAKLKAYASTAQIFGVSRVTAKTNAEFSAQTTANPLSPWYWWIVTERADRATAGANAIPMMYRITVIYYVEFYFRTWLGQS